MVYLDVHVRTPEMADGLAKSVHFPTSDTLGDDIRNSVFHNFPDATDYSFKEVSSKEVKRRIRQDQLFLLVRTAVTHASIQTQLDKKECI